MAADFGKKASIKPAGCCGFMGGQSAEKKKKAKASFDQTLVVLRHSERRDYMDKTYHSTEEGKKWPHDAELTARGHELAAEVAKEIETLHKTANFLVIACSPYRRCLETAAAVAKLLKLPVIVDQELGEVWGREMPQEPNPFRLGKELRELIESLGIKDANPTVDDGLKLFGKPGKWPESLDAAKTRYLVRIETYIEESLNSEKNYILVTHADAVAAALQMFERGNADVQNLDFCARLIAKRSYTAEEKKRDPGIYGASWDITTKAVSAEIMAVDKGMEKYYEKQHMENVEEKAEAAAKRKANRTKTDAVFADSLKNFAAGIPEDDDDDDDDRESMGDRASKKSSPDRV